MLPEVPTVGEAGFPSLAISNWAMGRPKQTLSPLSAPSSSGHQRLGRFDGHRFSAGGYARADTDERFIASLTSVFDLWSEVIRRGKTALNNVGPSQSGSGQQPVHVRRSTGDAARFAPLPGERL